MDFGEAPMNGTKTMSKLAIAAALLAFCAPAWAADIAVPYTKAPPAPVYNWQGFYLGGNVGGAYGFENEVTPFQTVSFEPSGVIGGGQAGFNILLSANALIGIEGEFDWASTEEHLVLPSALGAITIKNSHNWYATLDGRLGWVNGPWLLYVKGGGAWMNESYALNSNLIPSIASASNTRSGWTAGGGIEYMLFPGWSAKVEYDFLDFGSQNVTVGGSPISVSTRVHEAKLGINYHWSP
jgi:opacity protein-like surface antigen